MKFKKIKNFKPIVPPYGKYQKESIVWGIHHQNSGLLLDLGLGKTYCAINVARYRIQQNGVNKVLILCPSTILENWKKEIDKFSEYESIVLHNSLRQNRIYLINQFRTTPELRFGLINYEAVPKYWDELFKLKPNMIIFDESARYVQTHSSKRTQASIALSDLAEYKMILTGTPIGNRPLDLWSQFRILDGGIRFGNNFYAFRNHFFNIENFGRYKKFHLKPESVPIMKSKIFDICIKYNKEDVLEDLPETFEHTIDIMFNEQLMSMYTEVKKQIISEIQTESGEIELTIRNILVKLLRLQQITSGFISDQGVVSKLAETPKLDTLIEEVETIIDVGDSTIIWCRFLHSIQMIEEALTKLKIPCITMFGATKDKYAAWKGFQKSKTKNVFIGQIMSGGIGIELFKIDSTQDKTQHMIFYENMWKLDVRLQALGRNDRIGNKNKVRYVDLLVQDTIDMKIINTIKENKDVADSILENGIEKFLG